MRSNFTLPALVVVAALVSLLVWLARRPAELGELEAAAGDVAHSRPADEASAGASGQRATENPSQSHPAPLARSSERDRVQAVKEWVAAWSEQRVGDYLACYSRTFAPEGGISRRQWEAERRARISAPRFVRVSITGLEIEMLGAGRAQATFLQHYRSDGYTDTVRKTLELISEDGRWRIQRESADAFR